MIRYLVSFDKIENLEIFADDFTEAATRAVEQVLRETSSDEEIDIPPLIMIKDADRYLLDADNYTWLINSATILANAGFYSAATEMNEFIKNILEEPEDVAAV